MDGILDISGAPPPVARQKSDGVFRRLAPLQAAGRRQRAMLGRRIAVSAFPDVFDAIDFAGDAPFLSPALFSVGLDLRCADNVPAILGGFTRGEFAAVYEAREPRGHFIPRCGYLDRLEAGQTRELLFRDGRLVGEVPLVAPIPVCVGADVLPDGLQNLARIAPAARPVADAGGAAERLRETLAAIAASSAAHSAAILASLDHIVPFAAAGQPSFAHDLFPGVAFINLAGAPSPPALVEDLVHQSAHCLFGDVENSGAFGYFADPTAPIGRVRDGPSGARGVAELHHSAATLALSLLRLSEMTQAGAFGGADEREALARVGFLARRLAVDRAYLDGAIFLQGEARELHAALVETGAAAAEIHAAATRPFAYDAQGARFSLAAFLAENGRSAGERRLSG